MNIIQTKSKFSWYSIGAFILLACCIRLIFSCTNNDQTVDVAIPEDTVVQKVNIQYGLVTDSFKVVEASVKKNELLSHILLRHHIPYPEIDQLVKKAKGIFDVTRIRSGKNYTILCKNDSSEKAPYFIYERNAVDYVVCDLRGKMEVSEGQKEVTEIRREVAGEINSSLYQTLMDIDVSPAVAMSLSEIYAWSIDFYRIQKGDKFKIVYTDRYVEDTRVGVGDVQAAFFCTQR